MRPGTTTALLLLASTLLLSAGCSEEKPKVAEVTGVVTLKGEPLEFIHVEFWPENGPRAFGKTDSTGKFTLKTDDHTQTGAPIGKNKVALRDTWPSQDDYQSEGGDWVDMSNGKKSRIHSKYYDAAQSPLSVDVKPGELNNFDFPVDPRGK
jgi:hypothetical protein